jgi:hypothetical protein
MQAVRIDDPILSVTSAFHPTIIVVQGSIRASLTMTDLDESRNVPVHSSANGIINFVVCSGSVCQWRAPRSLKVTGHRRSPS